MDIELLTIEQVAERTGLFAHTLRSYERIGLPDPVGRATSGPRSSAARDLAWIEFLTRLRATGLPIRHMQEFAARLPARGYHHSQAMRPLRIVDAFQTAALNATTDDKLKHQVKIFSLSGNYYMNE